MMNDALREYVGKSSASPLTKQHIRDVLREEMPQVLRELTIGARIRTRRKTRVK